MLDSLLLLVSLPKTPFRTARRKTQSAVHAAHLSLMTNEGLVLNGFFLRQAVEVSQRVARAGAGGRRGEP